MQTLVFNSTTKTAVLFEKNLDSDILFKFENVPTVRVANTFYEVMKMEMIPTGERQIPVARFPVSNTNMLIEK